MIRVMARSSPCMRPATRTWSTSSTGWQGIIASSCGWWTCGRYPRTCASLASARESAMRRLLLTLLCLGGLLTTATAQTYSHLEEYLNNLGGDGGDVIPPLTGLYVYWPFNE